MPSLNLLLIDPNANFSKAARLFLSYRREISIVETTGDAQKALAIAGQLKPDIILIDKKLLQDNTSAQDLPCRLKEAAPRSTIIVLTLFNDSCIFSGTKEGDSISGFISKEQFAEAIVPLISAQTV